MLSISYPYSCNFSALRKFESERILSRRHEMKKKFEYFSYFGNDLRDRTKSPPTHHTPHPIPHPPLFSEGGKSRLQIPTRLFQQRPTLRNVEAIQKLWILIMFTFPQSITFTKFNLVGLSARPPSPNFSDVTVGAYKNLFI